MSDDPDDIGIQAQIDEVKLVILNREAWLERRSELQNAGKKVPPDTGCVAASLPALRAAVITLEFQRDNADDIRSLL